MKFRFANSGRICTFVPGEMAEWSIAAVLKTVDCQRSGGSNPTLSARKTKACKSDDCRLLFLGCPSQLSSRGITSQLQAIIVRHNKQFWQNS